MLNDIDQAILEKFQKYSHEIEENFAQMIALNPKLKLKYENNGNAFTDGNNITVDPALLEIFSSNETIAKALAILHWPENILAKKEDVLYVVEHAQLIHECLHQLYTEFPLPAYIDPIATDSNKRKILATIANIVEDAYIEAVGATKYNNIKFFLQFMRTCVSVCNNNQLTNKKEPHTDKLRLVNEFMNYFISYKLFPMDVIPTPSRELQEYIIKAKPLFNQAAMTANAKERYAYVRKIYDIILPLIPTEKEERIDQNSFNNRIPGSDSHNNNKTGHNNSSPQQELPSQSLFPQQEEQDSKNEFQTTLPDPTEHHLGDNLFDNISPSPSTSTSFDSQMKELNDTQEAINDLSSFMEAVNDASEKMKQQEEEDNNKTQCIRIGGDEFKEFTAHKDISVLENHIVPDKSLKEEYQTLYQEYKSNIEYYTSCFLQMLQTSRTIKESGYQFGSGLSKRNLGDPKKRYWYRNIDEQDTPDLAVLILIDGSGSMGGSKRTNAAKAALILHEVLGRQGINHAIVEHRAHNRQQTMEANILIDFNAKPNDKYNILKIRASNVNRDGLSLLWAERYIAKQSNDNKLIIVISDGQPNHNDYSGRVAKEDTHNIATRIIKHGIGLIAIALEENEQNVCYEDLKSIYPHLFNCNNPKNLTKQLLKIIKDVL